MRSRRSTETTSDLYLRLGLSYDELESGFVDAERTIRDNITRLSRENTIIDLQMQVDLTGLDEATDATRIFEIRQQALTRQIENQRDEVRLASAELRNMAERTGENSDQTQRARLALERQRLELARLEEQLQNLNDTQSETNESTGDFVERLSEMAGRFAPVIAGITAVAGALFEAGAASKELIEEWRELQTQAYQLNMSVNDTENFLRHMRLAGGEIDDFMGYIRGMTDAYTKGEFDDPEFLALAKYDAKITDATGRLKNFADITEEVYQAYLKAKEAGEEIEFLQLTGGESGVTDAIQYFERYAEAKEDAEKIFDAGLDPAEFHEAERALNLLTIQTEEFHDAAVNIITPATIQAMRELFDLFNSGTEFLVENKDALQEWGFIAAEAFSSVLNPLGKLVKEFNALIDAAPKLTLDIDDEDAKQAFQAITRDMETLNDTPLDAFKNYLADAFSNSDLVKRATENLIEYNDSIKGATKSWADFRKADEQASKETSNNPLSQYAIQRIKQFRDELEDLRNELDNAESEYKQAIGEVELWLKRELTDKLHVSDEERNTIEELYAAKLEQIEQAREDALEAIRAEVAAELDWSDLEKTFYDIEKTREDWISKGMDVAEAEELAERLKLDAIANLEEEVAQNINSIWQTELENRLEQIEREKQAWINKGVEEVKATQWAEQAKVDAQRNAAMSILKSQLKEYRAFQEGGYEGLRNYQLKQLYKSGIRPEDLQMTPEQLAAFQRAQSVAQKSLLPNFMTDLDRAEDRQQRNNSFVYLQNRLRAEIENIVSGMIVNGKQREMTRDVESFFGLVPKDTLPEVLAQSKELTAELADLGVTIKNLPLPEQPQSSTEPQAPEIPQPTLEPVQPELPETSELELPDFTNLLDSMEEVNGAFADLTLQLDDVTKNLADLAQALNEFSSSLPQIQSSQQANSKPTSITVTVQINEATAWDSEHIRQLADKVADVIEPEITKAIGGDSNGY